MDKVCSGCQIVKPSDRFYVKDSKTGRLDSTCKECRIVINASYAEQNVEKVKESRQSYYLENKEEILTRNKLTRAEKKTEYYEVKKIWRAENKDKVRGYRRKIRANRRAKDDLYKIKENLRSRYHILLKRKNLNKTAKFNQYIGCDLETLKNHLSSQFQDGMTWENYGIKGWHIDHIRPLDLAKNEEELIPLLHYTNLQPLWAADNYRKKNTCLE